jgi:hypothetical protein
MCSNRSYWPKVIGPQEYIWLASTNLPWPVSVLTKQSAVRPPPFSLRDAPKQGLGPRRFNTWSASARSTNVRLVLYSVRDGIAVKSDQGPIDPTSVSVRTSVPRAPWASNRLSTECPKDDVRSSCLAVNDYSENFAPTLVVHCLPRPSGVGSVANGPGYWVRYRATAKGKLGESHEMQPRRFGGRQ